MSVKKVLSCGKGILLAVVGVGIIQSSAFANQAGGDTATGRISFTGKIYEPACVIEVVKRDVISECYQQTHTVSQRLNLSGNRALSFNQNRVQAQINWIDRAQHLGIVDVSYL